MDEKLRALLAARSGHFRFESGHHGELALDLDTALWSPTALAPLVTALAQKLVPWGVEVVVGPLVGGALVAQSVAALLGASFTWTEREADGAGAGGLYTAAYRLPTATAPRLRGRRVAVVDDVVNAGSAVRSSLAAVVAADGTPVALAALIRLGETAVPLAAAAGLPLITLAVWPHALREPQDCPLCARQVPLEALVP